MDERSGKSYADLKALSLSKSKNGGVTSNGALIIKLENALNGGF